MDRFKRKKNIDDIVYKKQIYNDYKMKEYDFEGCDTLMVKACMGMGKTKNLKKIFNDYKDKVIVIVSFRITLDKEYINKFDNFILYSDIKENTYDTYFNKKLVVQIDSLHRIRGNIDLLILDEFMYTSTHLVEKVKYREAVYNTLYEYIENKETKIIVLDALLDHNCIKWFSKQKRKIKYIHNTYEKHDDKNIFLYGNSIGSFTEKIINEIKKGNKLIIPTNSKNFLNNLEKKILSNIKNVKIKFLDANNSDDINLDNWNNYDVVGYTPTIVAGVSYEDKHFDKCFAYFVSISAPADMALQQMFRVRNLNTNEIHICIEQKSNKDYPKNIYELEDHIMDKSKCLVDGVMGVKISRINNLIRRDHYYYIYRDIQWRIINSRLDYENELMNLLKLQGIKKFKRFIEKNIDLDKKIRKEMMENSTTIKDENIEDIINSEDIDDDTFSILDKKSKLTYEEKNKLKKKKFRINFNYNGNIKREVYKKYYNKITQYKNINTWYTFKDEIYKYLNNKLDVIEKNKIDRNNIVEGIMENDNLIFNENDRRKTTANTYILHNNKKYEKFLIGIEIINLFKKDLFDDTKFDIDFSKLYDYIKGKEYILRLLFNSNKFDINSIKNDDIGIKNMLKYLNTKLRSLFNIYIKKGKDNKYFLCNLEFWNEINPMHVNENLKMELYISSLIENILFND